MLQQCLWYRPFSPSGFTFYIKYRMSQGLTCICIDKTPLSQSSKWHTWDKSCIYSESSATILIKILKVAGLKSSHRHSSLSLPDRRTGVHPPRVQVAFRPQALPHGRRWPPHPHMAAPPQPRLPHFPQHLSFNSAIVLEAAAISSSELLSSTPQPSLFS